ncbi:hypothetical protein L8P39_08095 [Enterobacter cloacae]|uniref:hypothetical protein n=1 Tax=Enterobacter cloacae TaxID=550 RepID=UPI002006404E|nr:hypothetical protein [Enterobacter cloacae]MCK7102486.1 hypothetical protein [Enterobacter cloacae]
MRIALASLEAEPVAWLYSASFERGHVEGELTDAPGCDMPVYAAPPAPVSVPNEDLLHMAASAIEDLLSNKDRSGAGVWADVPAKLRRAAMLQSYGNSEQLNSPVVPDGYVLVPVEPTEDMVVNGFESEPDESFSAEKEWEAYNAMSGCQQAAHRARLCWSAMIASRPKLKHDLT